MPDPAIGYGRVHSECDTHSRQEHNSRRPKAGYIPVNFLSSERKSYAGEASEEVRVNTNVDPWLSSLSARIVPTCARTMCLAMASPKPVPPDSRERALSTR